MMNVSGFGEVVTIYADSQLLRIFLAPDVTVLSGILLTIILFEIWLRNSGAYQKLKFIPAPMRIPVLGHLHLAMGWTKTQINDKALGLFNTYGETICTNFLQNFYVFITNPVDIDNVLNNDEQLRKSDEYRYFKPWLGNGLLISAGEHWKNHHNMIFKSFDKDTLKSYLPKMAHYSRLLANKIEHLVHYEINLHKDLCVTALSIMLSTCLGVRKVMPESTLFRYSMATQELCDMIHKRKSHALYRFDTFYDISHMSDRWEVHLESCRIFVNEAFELHLQDSKGDRKANSALDKMLELMRSSELHWTRKDVIDEINTFLFMGQDTFATTCSFALCLLAIHQKVQTLAYQEQCQIFGNEMQRDCTYEDVEKMNYLERLIKETLRLYPTVPVVARKTKTDLQLDSGPYTIPKGTTIVLSLLGTHHRGDIYPDPSRFEPDNFLPERVMQRHPCSFIPFGTGARGCPGQSYAILEIKVLLSTLIRRFRLRSTITEDEFQLRSRVFLKLENGYKIIFEERSLKS